MTAQTALAAITNQRQPGAPIPIELVEALHACCAGAWRAIEIALAGNVLRGRLAKARDPIARRGIEAVLGLGEPLHGHLDALPALRAAREAGAFEGPLDLAVVNGPPLDLYMALDALAAALADHPALTAVVRDAGVLLVRAAQALVRAEPLLARWAYSAATPGDQALAGFAEVMRSPAALAEVESLIARPIQLDDNVQFTVYRPRTIDPGKWHPLVAFAHLAERRPGEDDLPDPVEEVKRQAQQVLGERAQAYQPVTQDAGAAIPAEGELTFVPELPGIEINPPRRTFSWLEPVHREEFRMRAGAELHGKTVRGRLTVFLGAIVIAEITLSVKVDAARPEPHVSEQAVARTYRKIFASYSHRDVAIVNQFESYARAMGDDYLRDWVHLRTGEVWNDRLLRLIEEADAFQLFWSHNSMHSKFVRQEYDHALSLNRPSFVRPTYWEDPMPTGPNLPPEHLARLHFQKLGAALVAPVGASSAGPQPMGAAIQVPAPAPRPVMTSTGVCDRCGKENQSHYKFCLGCGCELTASGPGPAGGDLGMMKTMMADPAPSALPGPMGPAGPMNAPMPLGSIAAGPPAVGMPPPSVTGFPLPGFVPPGPNAAPALRRCPSCGRDVPPSFRFCGTCGFRMDEAVSPMAVAPQLQRQAPFALMLIRNDGSEGGRFELRAGINKVGRTVDPIFETDRYLSPLHAEIEIRGNGAIIRDLASVNGVFVQLTQEEELTDGQVFRIGQQIVRFDRIPEATPTDDTDVVCSPNPGYWGKLTTVIGHGLDGAAYLLFGGAVTLGRSVGDIKFEDDGFMSGLHARVSLRESRVYLADLGSSNGTFIKVSERAIGDDSRVLLGQLLFRFDSK